MIKNVKHFLHYLLIALFLLPQFLNFPISTAKAQTPPTPSGKFDIFYDPPNKRIIETNTITGERHTYTQTSDLIQPTYESVGNLPGKPDTGVISDDSFLSFTQDGFNKIRLLVNVRTRKVVGLWTKSGSKEYQNNWLLYTTPSPYDRSSSKDQLFAYYAPLNLPGLVNVFVQERQELTGADWQAQMPHIKEMNGYFQFLAGADETWYRDNIGYGTTVDNLFPRETIGQDITLCGTVNIDFSQSKLFESLPADVKSKLKPVAGSANTYAWPGDIGGIKDARLYLLYEHDGVWTRATMKNTGGTWAFDRRFEQLAVGSDGKFTSRISLKDFPKGKYKLQGSIYLRKQNDGTVRFDVPNSGFLTDYFANMAGSDTSANEDLQIETTEFDFSGDSIDAGQEGVSPNCLTLAFGSKIRNFESGGSLSDRGDGVCSTTSTGIIAMLEQGLCALTVTLKNWADGFFTWAESWMEQSIGIARNKSGTAPDSLPEIKTSDPGASSGATATSSGTTGASTLPVTTTAPTASTGDITYSSPIIQTAENFRTAAVNTCKAAQTDKVDLTKQPCLIKNLTYTKYGSSNTETVDTKSGIQIVKDGLNGMTNNFTKPNKCGVDTLIILKTNCEYSGTKGTPAGD